MERIVNWLIKVAGGVLLAVGAFFVGWLLRAVKAKRQLKDQKEHYTKK